VVAEVEASGGAATFLAADRGGASVIDRKAQLDPSALAPKCVWRDP
jgi:hypothetical protein